MRTAMQELLSEMSHPNWDRLSFDARYEMFDKLLDLEKEQIKDAYDMGETALKVVNDEFIKNAEDYYNLSYNQNKQNFCYSCGGDKGEHALFCQFCRLEH